MAKRLSGRRGLMALLTLLLIAAWAVTLRPAALGGPATYVIVDGTSMEPTYFDGDLVIARSQGAYSNGDVIAYYPATAATDRAALTIHRIIGRDEQGAYLTQGDNRPEPDQWVAPLRNVEGAAWLHVPGAGTAVLWLREPQHFAGMITGFIGFSVVQRTGSARKSRRRQGGHMHHENHNKRPSGLRLPQLPVQGRTVGALGGLVLVALLLMAMAFSSYRSPTETERTEIRESYQQTAVFDYTMQMKQSILYPDGVVGPIAPVKVNGEFQSENAPAVGDTAEATDEDASTAGTPIFRTLAKSMDLGFKYSLASELQHEVSGQYSAVLEILAGEDGWMVTEELLPPTAFEGTDISFRVPIDFSAISATIAAIEEQTEFTPNTYTISVIPSVTLQGSVGAETIAETYAPAFTLDLTDVQITPTGELVQTDAASSQETIVEASQMTVAGLTMSVTQARRLSTIGLGLVLAGGLALAAVSYLRLRRDENSLIKVRYRPMLISVAEADMESDSLERVRLASMQDLARLAQKDGQIIFQQERGPDGQRYFVRHGAVVYEYCAGQSELVTSISSN